MIEVPYAAEVVSDLRGLKQMVERFNPAFPLYFDTETTGYEGSDMRSDRPVSLQFHQGETTWIVDVRRPGRAGRRQIGSILLPALQDTLLVGHNLKFDLEILLIHFGILPRRVWCTMIAEQVIHGLGLSDGRTQGVGFGLKALAERRGMGVEKETRESFKNMHLTPAWNTPFTPEQIEYMAQDVQVLPAIYASQVETFDLDYSESPDTTKTLWGCFNLEMQVTPALAHIETGGLLVDWDGTHGSEGWMNIIGEKEKEANLLKEQVTEVLGAAIDEVRQRRFEEEWGKYEAWEQARDLELERLHSLFNEPLIPGKNEYKPSKWGDFKTAGMQIWRVHNPNPGRPKKPQDLPNIGSQQQLLMAFAELGIPAKDTTEGTLEELSEDYPVVAQLMKYRKAVKFVQSFGETLKQETSAEDERLHPDFIQIGASSNRMSCKNPNLQQIPSRSDAGKRLRKCVVARPGYKILDADFGSQELCIIAELSGDENMLGVFERGEDPHWATARMMFNLGDGAGLDPKKFKIGDLVARDAAKTINYGLAYGLTAYGLSFQLGVPVSSAEELIERWYTPYAGVRRYFDERKRQVFRGPLYSETQHGWRRHYEPLPPEPRKPYSSQPWSNERTQAHNEWKDAHRAWEKKKRRLENKLMNTPIQGSGAGVTKLALADFFDYIVPLNESEVIVQILAPVHDELVVEVREDYVQEVAAKLAECMDGAMRYFLPRVNFPKSAVSISDYWSK